MGDLNRALRQQRFSKRNAVFLILGSVALIGWPYVLFMSEAFTVNAIEVGGVKTLDPIDVSREVFDVLDRRGEWRPWPARHAWFVDREALAHQLKDKLFVANVIVDKSYSNVLRLSVEERSKKVIYHSHKQYYWVDIQGVATDELSIDERKVAQARLLGQRLATNDDAPIIKTDLDYEIAKGTILADGRRAKEWIKLAEDLKSYKLLYREVEPPTASSTLFKVLSQEGFDVLMDITAPLDLQVKTYLGFIKAKPAGLKPLDYVDVRVPGRVYLKEQ
jgi:hypothetical protein